MRSILYIVAVVLVIIWLVGMFGGGDTHFGMGNLVHILLVIAIISLLLGFIRRGTV